jgi:hypothetical protein
MQPVEVIRTAAMVCCGALSVELLTGLSKADFFAGHVEELDELHAEQDIESGVLRGG